MRFVLYTHSYSPHELPLFKACAEMFEEAWYVVDRGWNDDPSRNGWKPDLTGLNTMVLEQLPENERRKRIMGLLDDQTLIMYGTRGNPYENEIVGSRAIVVYASERWLKPLKFLPGVAHWIKPSFAKMVFQFRRWIRENPRFFCFGLGVYAVNDMSRLMKAGSVESIERAPAGRVTSKNGLVRKIRLWGYFIAPSHASVSRLQVPGREPLRVLWVGRMLDWKRVDTLIRAVHCCKAPVELTLVGNGPKEQELKMLARSLGVHVLFKDFVPMEDVRRLMRENEIYVLPSNSYEGWGAVVNEALDAGMIVLSSRVAGAGATMLPEECLFDVGDWSSRGVR